MYNFVEDNILPTCHKTVGLGGFKKSNLLLCFTLIADDHKIVVMQAKLFLSESDFYISIHDIE